MTDQVTGDGMPSAPMDDEDFNIDNKGQRIGVILVLVVILAAGVAGFMMYSKKQAKIEEVDTLVKDFSGVHANAYDKFWMAAKLDVKELKNNIVFEKRISEYLEVSSISYSEHVKSEALPLLEEAVIKYKTLEVSGILIPEIKAVTTSLTNLVEAWQHFVNQVSLYKGYLKNRSKLTEIAGQWRGAQLQPKEEKFTADAAKYLKIVNCVLQDKTVFDYDAVDLSYRVKDTCAKVADQGEWFSRVAFRCLDIVAKEIEADAVYQETLKKYAAEESQNQDSASNSSIDQCLDISRKTFESELAMKIFEARLDYNKKKNALLDAAKKYKETL